MRRSTNRTIPGDDFDAKDLSTEDWARDDKPDRFYDRLSGNSAHFDAVLGEIREHQATLAQIRKARSLTQTAVATQLEMDQSEVSRLERRSDMLLSTLRSFIQAAGGELELIVTFPESDPVHLLVGDGRVEEHS